jgi:excisionase family DNA binding protein
MNDNGNERKLYTLKEAAALLRVSYITAYRMVRSGKLRAVQIGKLWRVPVSEIERLTEELPFSEPPF